jgi:hypothetical protein
LVLFYSKNKKEEEEFFIMKKFDSENYNYKDDLDIKENEEIKEVNEKKKEEFFFIEYNKLLIHIPTKYSESYNENLKNKLKDLKNYENIKKIEFNSKFYN